MYFTTLKEAKQFASARKKGFMQLAKETDDKKRISMLKAAMKSVKIKPNKAFGIHKGYNVLGQ